MLRTALQLRKAITRYQEVNFRDFDDGDSISPADWAALAGVVNFFQPFEQVIREVEGDRTTLDNVLVTMDFLVAHYKAAHVSVSHSASEYQLTCLLNS